MDIWLRILFGFLGIVLYAFLSAKDKDDVTVPTILSYFKQYFVKWVLVLFIIVSLAIIMHFAPDAAEGFQALTALQVTTNAVSFAWLGYNMSSVGRKINNF